MSIVFSLCRGNHRVDTKWHNKVRSLPSEPGCRRAKEGWRPSASAGARAAAALSRNGAGLWKCKDIKMKGEMLHLGKCGPHAGLSRNPSSAGWGHLHIAGSHGLPPAPRPAPASMAGMCPHLGRTGWGVLGPLPSLYLSSLSYSYTSEQHSPYLWGTGIHQRFC